MVSSVDGNDLTMIWVRARPGGQAVELQVKIQITALQFAEQSSQFIGGFNPFVQGLEY